MAYTAVLSLVAVLQWCTMKSTERWIGDTMISANRGWLRINSIAFANSPQSGAAMAFIIKAENIGKGPAKWIDTRVLPKTRSKPTAPLYMFPFGQNRACEGFGVDYGGQIAWPATEIEMTRFAFKALDESVRSGESVLYLHGCAAYMHFETVSKTWFCFYLDPLPNVGAENWKFRSCRDGHDVT